MAGIKLDIVTAERVVYSEEVEMVVAPGVQGQLGILPHHTPLMTILEAGELKVKKGGEETFMAISGGFLEVRPDRVIVLADAAERDAEIDLSRAEAAKSRAQEELRRHASGVDITQVEAALHRALVRIKVGERRRARRPRPLG